MKADQNPIQKTTENLDGSSIIADALAGGGGGDWDADSGESDVVDSSDSTDWSDSPSDDEVAADDAAEDAAEGDESAEDGDESGDESETGEGDAKATPETKKDVEEIEVTDETGRRKIEVDYSDRKAIRRAHEQAAGARKLYARNRELRAELEAAKPTIEAGTKALDRWNRMEAEYATKGMDGVIETLTGRPAEEYYAAREAENKRLAAMSPAERALYDRTRQTDKHVAEAQKIKEEAERIRAEAAAEREAADLEKVEALVHPEFERIRMKGKLGDPAREHRIDTMIWDYVQSELVRIAEKGTTPTRDLVRRTFEEASSLFSSAVEARASKQTAATLDKKKKEATREAQSAVVRGERQLRRKVESDSDFSHTAGAAAFLAAVASGGKRKK